MNYDKVLQDAGLYQHPVKKHKLSRPGKTVKQHNNLSRSKHRFRTTNKANERMGVNDTIARKISKLLISCIPFMADMLDDEYSVAVKDYIKVLTGGTSGVHYEQLSTACARLLRLVVEVRTISGTDKATGSEYEGYTIFSRITYKKGVITATFNHLIEPYLLRLTESFTLISLDEFFALKTPYSQALFEYLLSWKNFRQREITVSIEELHRFLQPPPSSIANYAEFNRRILEKAHADIVNSTSLQFSYKAKKVGKQITAVTFIFGGYKSPNALPVPVSQIGYSQTTQNAQRDNHNQASRDCFIHKTNKNCINLNSKPSDVADELCRYCIESGAIKNHKFFLERSKKNVQ